VCSKKKFKNRILEKGGIISQPRKGELQVWQEGILADLKEEAAMTTSSGEHRERSTGDDKREPREGFSVNRVPRKTEFTRRERAEERPDGRDDRTKKMTCLGLEGNEGYI